MGPMSRRQLLSRVRYRWAPHRMRRDPGAGLAAPTKQCRLPRSDAFHSHRRDGRVTLIICQVEMGRARTRRCRCSWPRS